MAHDGRPSSWILPTVSALPRLLLLLLCQVILAFQPTPLSYWQMWCERSWNICYEILPVWKKKRKEKKRLAIKQAVLFNIKGCFLFPLLSRFQVEVSLKFAENLYPQDLSPLYLTGWFPLVYPCIPACSRKQDSTHWAKCLLCHKLAFKKLASQRKGT